MSTSRSSLNYAALEMTGGCGYIFIKEKINEAKERCIFSLAHRAN